MKWRYSTAPSAPCRRRKQGGERVAATWDFGLNAVKEQNPLVAIGLSCNREGRKIEQKKFAAWSDEKKNTAQPAAANYSPSYVGAGTRPEPALSARSLSNQPCLRSQTTVRRLSGRGMRPGPALSKRNPRRPNPHRPHSQPKEAILPVSGRCMASFQMWARSTKRQRRPKVRPQWPRPPRPRRRNRRRRRTPSRRKVRPNDGAPRRPRRRASLSQTVPRRKSRQTAFPLSMPHYSRGSRPKPVWYPSRHP